jgi:hypothetical protein
MVRAPSSYILLSAQLSASMTRSSSVEGDGHSRPRASIRIPLTDPARVVELSPASMQLQVVPPRPSRDRQSDRAATPIAV